ncbi:hypothetical protein KBH77_02840 [Patescibacteria group bacterium]|nr:hypothetical protein [Patescibacteria group bacterium]
MQSSKKFIDWCEENYMKNIDDYILEVAQHLRNKEVGLIKTFKEYEKDSYIQTH